jgi:hypothetical protein
LSETLINGAALPQCTGSTAIFECAFSRPGPRPL